MHPPYVAVVGPSLTTPAPSVPPEGQPDLLGAAHEAGRLLAAAGCVVVTGGLGGVMAAAAAGAREWDGVVVAILPGHAREDASDGHTVVIPTGMGEMRNALLVRTADAVLAVGGAWGTLSEIALAARTGVPVFAVDSWDLPGPEVTTCGTVTEAVDRILQVLPRSGS